MKTNNAKEIIETALDSLVQSIENGQSEMFLKYLETMSRFHNYSLRNIMLLTMQRPESTHVAGFHAWKKFDRYVRKGEKGIAIIAPLVYKTESIEDDNGDQSNTSINGYKVVYVFDISQTDGQALPTPSSVQGDPSDHIIKIEKLIAHNNITLEYTESSEYEGCSLGGKIIIRNGLSPAQDFSVKVHELAHEFLHHSGKKFLEPQKETEAEAVAYVVCHSIGLDTNTAFSDYIQFYKGKKDTLMHSIQSIKDVSGRILDGIN